MLRYSVGGAFRYRRRPVARQGEVQQATAGVPFTKVHVDLTGLTSVQRMVLYIY